VSLLLKPISPRPAPDDAELNIIRTAFVNFINAGRRSLNHPIDPLQAAEQQSGSASSELTT
jgi:hypothetical protein